MAKKPVLLLFVSLLGLASCAAPYAKREIQLLQGKNYGVRQDGLRDVTDMGQFGVNGKTTEIVKVSNATYHTEYLHNSEMAQGILPLAYRDMARAAFNMRRYTDAIRLAKNSIAQGAIYYGDDKWAAHRAMNLVENYKILSDSYLYLGDLQNAATCHKQSLVLSQTVNSKSFKALNTTMVRFRMTSKKKRSIYLAKQHWSNLQILVVVAAVAGGAYAGAQSGAPQTAPVIAAEGALLLAMIADYKTQLKLRHGIELDSLLARAEQLSKLPPPTLKDIRRVQMSSDLYNLANARQGATEFDMAEFIELKEVMADIRSGLSFSVDTNGLVRVRGDLAALIATSMRIDEIPTKLPPPPEREVEEYLDKFLTPNMYKMAGLKMTADEGDFFNKLMDEGRAEYTFDPTTQEGREVLQGLRKMMQKSEELDQWFAQG